MGPSVTQSTGGLPFRLDQFLGSRSEELDKEGDIVDVSLQMIETAAESATGPNPG